MVLTDADYKDFNARNAYLAAKLLTIFLEHPVIFIGYSLTDDNIINILTAIAACMRTENLEKLQDHLIFVEWRPKGDPEFGSTAITIDHKIIPITTIKTNSFIPIFESLAGNKSRFPARILRKLKSHIYELVKNHDPAGQMFVRDLEKESENSPIQVVYGVGILPDESGDQGAGTLEATAPTYLRQSPLDHPKGSLPTGETGYRRIPRNNLLRDVVFDDGKFDPEMIV